VLGKKRSASHGREGVLVVHDSRLGIVERPDHGHDVETSGMLQEIVSLEPGQGQSREASLLDEIHRIRRIASMIRAASLHFHEHDRPLHDGHEIDFAQTTATAAIDHAEATFSQELLGREFASPP